MNFEGDVFTEDELRREYQDYARECAHYGESCNISYEAFLSDFEEVE